MNFFLTIQWIDVIVKKYWKFKEINNFLVFSLKTLFFNSCLRQVEDDDETKSFKSS